MMLIIPVVVILPSDTVKVYVAKSCGLAGAVPENVPVSASKRSQVGSVDSSMAYVSGSFSSSTYAIGYVNWVTAVNSRVGIGSIIGLGASFVIAS